MPDKAKMATPEYREAKKIDIPKTLGISRNWRAIAYEAKTKDRLESTDWPAKLCFCSEDGKVKQDCFQAIAVRKDATWNCQFVRELSLTPIFEKKYPQEGVLFVPMFSGGGSGTLNLITLWVFSEQMKKFVNILPVITITNLGQYKILHDRQDQLDGTLVIADFIWKEGETHFDPHQYEINIYKYNQEHRLFEMVGSFVTKDTYPEVEGEYDIVSHEIENIENLVSKR
ncbi:MAG: hypothetical protein WBG50_07060 [Desulfomonilaceae bacterium]